MDCKWDVSEWRYSGEGGKHALFAYYQSPFHKNNTKQEVLEWTGRLLRLDKKLFRNAGKRLEVEDNNQQTKLVHSLPADDDAGKKKHSDRMRRHSKDDSLMFLREIMKPHFDQYMDLPECVSLSWQFVKDLCRVTLESQPCVVPKARRKDWVATDNDDESPQEDFALAWLVPEYRQHTIISRSLVSASGPCVSVEIKPKAGYIASSPLVEPKHAAKFTKSRFVLLQALDRLGYSGMVPRGWKDTSDGSEKEEMFSLSSTKTSSYDPMDLFSGDTSRIQQAIHAMWECPQNNFKLWFSNADASVDGDPTMLIVGQCSEIAPDINAENTSNQLLADFFQTGVDCHTPTMKPFLVDLIACILQSECTFLRKLRQWQLLDILDGDGAIRVYQRLVELCQGSHEEAQKLLDSSYYSSVKKDVTDNPITAPLPGSPLDPPLQHCPAFEALCRDIRHFSEAMQRQQARFCNSDDNSKNLKQEKDIQMLLLKEHKTCRAACLKHIVSIQAKEACRYLLQNWLLSLAICDVSFFVTMQCAPLKMAGKDGNATKTRLLQHQSGSEPGMVETFVSFDKVDGETVSKGMAFYYTIKLIDCDKKPSKKLETRAKKEEVFQYI
jgi:Inositol-pentakisphosphate 2-kinase